MGELLAEVMRPERDSAARRPGAVPGAVPQRRAGHLHRHGRTAGRRRRDRERRGGRSVRAVRSRTGWRATACARITWRSCRGMRRAWRSWRTRADGSREFLFHWPHTAAVQAVAPCPGDRRRRAVLPRHGLLADGGRRRSASGSWPRWTRSWRPGARVSFDPNMRLELAGADAARAVAERVLRAPRPCCSPAATSCCCSPASRTWTPRPRPCSARPRMEVVAVKLGRRGARVYTRGGRGRRAAYPVDGGGSHRRRRLLRRRVRVRPARRAVPRGCRAPGQRGRRAQRDGLRPHGGRHLAARPSRR